MFKVNSTDTVLEQMQQFMQPWFNQKYYLHECDRLVRIYGRWCGPNWTDGRRISALDYKQAGGDFKGRCVDALDCACRAHDKACARPSGCSAKADRKLAVVAATRALVSRNPAERAYARLIAAGILAVSVTR